MGRQSGTKQGFDPCLTVARMRKTITCLKYMDSVETNHAMVASSISKFQWRSNPKSGATKRELLVRVSLLSIRKEDMPDICSDAFSYLGRYSQISC